VAAYRGHEAILQLCLHQRYCEFNYLAKQDVIEGAYPATIRNQTNTLRLTMEYMRKVSRAPWVQYLPSHALVWSCERGAHLTAKVTLEYGANPNATDRTPRSCLQLAARSGSAALVKMLLDSGAHLNAANFIRTGRRREPGWLKAQPDAYTEASRRGYVTIVRLIEEKKRTTRPFTRARGVKIDEGNRGVTKRADSPVQQPCGPLKRRRRG
jgi:ankyrin repeat protein